MRDLCEKHLSIESVRKPFSGAGQGKAGAETARVAALAGCWGPSRRPSLPFHPEMLSLVGRNRWGRRAGASLTQIICSPPRSL